MSDFNNTYLLQPKPQYKGCLDIAYNAQQVYEKIPRAHRLC